MDFDDTKGIFLVMLGVALMILAFWCPWHWHAYLTEKAAMEKGYEQRLEGNQKVWVKTGKE